MEIKYTLNLQDIIEFNIYHYYPDLLKAKKNRKIILSIPLALISILIFFVIRNNDFTTSSIIGIIVISIFLFSIFLNELKKPTREKIEKSLTEFYSKGKNLDLTGNKVLFLNDNNIIAISDYSHSEIKWEAIEKYILTDKHLFLYANTISSFIIPLNNLEKKQIEEIKLILAEKIKITK